MRTDTTPKAEKVRRPAVHALIPAAGRGVRFGTAENKIFAKLAGQCVIERTLQCLAGQVDSITLVGHSSELSRLKECCNIGRPVKIVAGGETRQQSVLAGLLAIDAPSDDIVLVHDGARPLLNPALIVRVSDAAVKHGCAIAALPISDTIKAGNSDSFIESTRSREGLWAAQTPQGARLGLLRNALLAAERDGFSGTDEASVVERLEQSVKLVIGTRENIKITTQDDLAFAESWLKSSLALPIRIGSGYDIHQLVLGRKLVLGGVEIENDRGLLGHSDADVVLHAICDALLGAAALPDIGHLFPNTDPKYAGIDSLKLLDEVAARLLAEGYTVGNVDCCIIAERPKISPYSEQMRRNIAKSLRTDINRISVKATTNEGLGSLGAGEGIACHATATIIAAA